MVCVCVQFELIEYRRRQADHASTQKVLAPCLAEHAVIVQLHEYAYNIYTYTRQIMHVHRRYLHIAFQSTQ
jgi:hypothetical protein